MTLWLIILWTVMGLLGLSAVYIGFRMPKFLSPETVSEWSKIKFFLAGGWCVICLTGLITLCLDFVNAVVCVIYLALIWMISDTAFYLIQKFFHFSFQHYYAGYTAIVVWLLMLSTGWYLNHHVWATHYTLTTDKNVSPLKIALFADAHLGTTFGAEGFAKHLKKLQNQKPDLVIVAGDYADDNTTREEMVKATQALGQIKTKYGIFFVFGNHDKGYFGAAYRGFSGSDLINELQKNGITVLQDEVVSVGDDFYLIGRRDVSEIREKKGHRQSMDELVANLDKNKYLIVADHQPTDYKNQAKSGVDLVLSGHTHGGQLWPLNQVGKWIGANDLIYGHKKHQQTNFIVTSGISCWAIQFKTGTKSEFVIIHIQKSK